MRVLQDAFGIEVYGESERRLVGRYFFAMFFDRPTGKAWASLTAIALNALYPDVI